MSSAEPTNLVSNKHPHEPEVAPVYDPEGRCLVCGCEWRDQEIAVLKQQLEGFVRVKGYCGFEDEHGQIAIVGGAEALTLARHHEPFPVYRYQEAGVEVPDGE